MLKSIANNPRDPRGDDAGQIDAAIAKYAEQETPCDQPEIDRSKARVTGPFTVDAVPAPVVRSVSEEMRRAEWGSHGHAFSSHFRQP